MTKLNKHRRKPMGIKRLTQLLKQHLYDTGLMLAFVDPQYTPEEHAQARFLLSQVDSMLTQAEGNSPRVSALVHTLAYQQLTQGVINYLTQAPPEPESGATPPFEDPEASNLVTTPPATQEGGRIILTDGGN